MRDTYNPQRWPGAHFAAKRLILFYCREKE